MAGLAQNRLIRKEVALGTLRELQPPTTHIGLSQLCPWKEVASDDVIFDYARGLTQEGLAPARAEDAESELAQKDFTFVGSGRASVIDWALKDHYTASDVTRYQEALLISDRLGPGASATAIPYTGNAAEEFRTKVVRDDALRRRKLDNRMEWMIMTALDTAGISYNDGKIKFTVDYVRPTNQTNQPPLGGILFNDETSDPIGTIKAAQKYMWDTYAVRMTRGIASQAVLDSFVNSNRFVARVAPVVGGTPSSPIDLDYLADSWGTEVALRIVERATGLTITPYDSVYRTRALGSNTVVNNRFLSDKKLYLLPNPDDLAEIDDDIGFGRMLTSPHPEGQWQPGFYEWERETVDPWGVDRGVGVKAFPIFPHMDLTYTITVLP